MCDAATKSPWCDWAAYRSEIRPTPEMCFICSLYAKFHGSSFLETFFRSECYDDVSDYRSRWSGLACRQVQHVRNKLCVSCSWNSENDTTNGQTGCTTAAYFRPHMLRGSWRQVTELLRGCYELETVPARLRWFDPRLLRVVSEATRWSKWKAVIRQIKQL